MGSVTSLRQFAPSQQALPGRLGIRRCRRDIVPLPDPRGLFSLVSRWRSPTVPDPATMLAQASQLASSGRIDRAITLLTKTIRLSPQLWQAFQYRGELHVRHGNAVALAVQDFSEAIRLAPREPHLYLLRGHAYSLLGDDSSSRNDYENASALSRAVNEASLNWARRAGRLAKPKLVTEASLRIPRITRLMTLAVKFQNMVDRGEVRDYADLARLGLVTRAGSRTSGRSNRENDHTALPGNLANLTHNGRASDRERKNSIVYHKAPTAHSAA